MRTRADILTEIDLPQGKVTVDEYGYITNPDLWTPEFAHHTAEKEGITLTDDHWEIINYMRDAHEQNGVAVDVRFVLKLLSNKHNTNKSGAKDVFFSLFPSGYVKQACKISGMRQPRAWSTG